MKALVAGFHMMYRLSQDSKYPWPSLAVELRSKWAAVPVRLAALHTNSQPRADRTIRPDVRDRQ